jgi:MFS transporter, DHA1 family, quinolone resistance protein
LEAVMKTVKQIQRTYYLVNFLFWLATALPAALMVLFMQARGLSLFQVGLVMGAYSLTIVLLELPTGGLADAVGRKRVTLLAYSFMLVNSVLTLLAFSFPMFLLSFILYGVGRALTSGALDAWFVDALQTAEPDIEIQPSLAQAETFALLALGVGTLLGSALPRFFAGLPAEGTAVFTPLAIPIVISLLLKMLLLRLVAVAVQERRPLAGGAAWRQELGQTPAVIRDAFRLSRRNPTLVLLLAVSVVSGLMLAGLETFWQPHFAALLPTGANSLFFGVIMAGSFLVGMAGNMAATPLSRWFNRRYGLVAAVFQALRGLILILLALQTAVAPAAALFWLVYLSAGVINSPHATLVNRQIPADRRSTMLSVQSLAFYLGSILGSVGLGYLAEVASISAAWLVAGVLTVVSLALYWQVDARQQRNITSNASIPEAC